MTHEEKQFCTQCAAYDQCGFVSRKLEYKCPDLDKFSAGMDAAISKAAKWMDDELHKYIMEGREGKPYISVALIDDFKKAMNYESLHEY